MLIGLTVGHYDGIATSGLLKIAQQFGVEFVEFNRSLLDDVEACCRQIGKTASGYHLPLVEEDGFDISCRSRAAEIDRVITVLNTNHSRLNLRYALTHPPQPDLAKENLQSSDGYWLENLQRLQVPILIENVTSWPPHAFDDLVKRLRASLGAQFLGVCFDGPHAYLAGEDVLQRFTQLAPEIRAFHLSDCSRSEDLHLPFNMGGVFPIEKFLEHIRRCGAGGILNLEINPGSLKNLPHLIESYLMVLKHFHPAKYYAAKTRLLWRLPFIRKELRRLKGQSQAGNPLLAT